MPTADGRLTAQEAATLLALVEAQAAVRQQLTAGILAAVLATWSGIGSWWRSADTSRAIDQTLRLLIPAQRRMAQTTDAYLARVLTVFTGRTVRPVGAVDVTRLRRRLDEQTVADLLAGRRQVPRIVLDGAELGKATGVADPMVDLGPGVAVQPADVWGRIPDAYRWQVVAQGVTDQQAAVRAMRRIENVVSTDIALADRAQARRVLVDRERLDGIIGWRRIVRPELSRTGPCGLCVVAADRIYSVRDLMPLHPVCVCTVMPVTRTADPGLNLLKQDLERVYTAAGGTAAAKLQRIRVAVTEHGELGPILVDADHRVRGPVEAARTAKGAPRPTQARAQLESLQKTYPRLIARQRAGEDVDRALRWQERMIGSLRAELGI